jgi:hypothetical protein
VALQRPDANKAPVETPNPPQGLDEHAMALARDQACDTEERPSRAPRALSRRFRFCRAWRDDGNPVWGNTMICHSDGSSPAGTENAAKSRQHGSLKSGELRSLSPGKSGFLGKGMVDQGDQPQATRLGRDHPLQPRQGEAVDNRYGSVGKGVKSVAIGARRELDELDGTSAGAQPVQDVTVVQISTGQLIKPAGDDEDEFGLFTRSQGG